MQVLLINPKKKTKRGAKMAKKKTKRRKTTARKRKTTITRRKIRTRRNPSMNPLVAYMIGGFTGLTTSKLIDSIKPVTLPFGITAGNITSAAAGYLMYRKTTGTARQIAAGHLASAVGLIAVNLLDGITGGKVLKGGLHEALEEGYSLQELEPEETQILESLEEYQQEPELQIIG